MSAAELARTGGKPRIAYREAGAGEVVVLMHGIGGNSTNWLRQLDALADGYRAVAWDARGYGGSDDYDGPLDFAEFAVDLLRLLDHLAAPTAHLCGLSMGGRIALDFYERYPERVRSLILADTFPGFDSSFTQEGRERFVQERRQPLVDGRELSDIAPRVAATLVAAGTPDTVRQELIDSMCALHKASYIKTIEAMTMYQPVTDVSRVTVPVQIIVGEEDKLTPVTVSRKMFDEMPDARLEILPATGHLSNVEQPALFNACLRDFLDGLPRN